MFAVLIYDFILQPKNIAVQISMRKRTQTADRARALTHNHKYVRNGRWNDLGLGNYGF